MNIKKRLNIVSEAENINITPEAIDQIAQTAEGGMRDALSLLDQSVSYSTSDEITLDDVLQVSGNVSYIKIIELLNECISNNETNATYILDKLLKEGKEVPRIINDIIIFLRDILLFKNNAILEEKIMYSNSEFVKLANLLNKKVIYNWLDILNESLNNMSFSTQKRAFLELAILKMNDNVLNEEVNILNRLEAVENTIAMFKNIEVKQPKQETYNISIPSVEEINNIIEEKKTIVAPEDVYEEPIIETKPIINTSDEITVRDIEKILNNANKEKKEALLKIWNKIADEHMNVFAIHIMVNGNIVAVSDDSFIVELQDEGFCNRVMKYENYVKIIEIFNENNLNIKDYICVPKSAWNVIKKDYGAKYKSGITKPILEEVKIGVKRRQIPTSQVNNNNLYDDVFDLFDKENVKIVEE